MTHERNAIHRSPGKGGVAAPRRFEDGARAPPRSLLGIQQQAGNRAVLGLVQAQAKPRIGTPHDELERAADRVADEVMRTPEGVEPVRPIGSDLPATRPPTDLADRVMKEDLDHRVEPGDGETGTGASPGGVEGPMRALRTGGRPLPRSVRNFFEPRFGRDFGQVQIHDGREAGDTARTVGARAYTLGRHIVVGPGDSASGSSGNLRLLAHELTHVVQQESAGIRLQCYEAGEHAQLGETQAQLQAARAPASHTVQERETLAAIAKKFGLTVEELKDANKARLKRWPAKDGSGREIEGFNAGETILIPQSLSDFAKAASADPSAKFTVNGVVLDYGVGIAMGDFFANPEEMAKAPRKELEDLAALITRERSGGKEVSTEEWQKATGGRYLKLAEKNEAHFAPPNAQLVTASTTGAGSANHKDEWEKHHKAAVDASRSGDKDKALMINSFADHFLTDAFAAGHLINKRDVMEKFKGQLPLDPKGTDFVPAAKTFFDDVAKDSFTGGVKTEFSKYETFESVALGWNPNFDTVDMFSRLLQGIHKEDPDLLANAVAKGVHDKLNTIPVGVPVVNAKGDPAWELSGDGTLNTKSKEIALKAVAQSQTNVISAYKSTAPIDYSELYKRVWDYTPRPNPAGAKVVVDAVDRGTGIKSPDLKKAVVKLIQDNYLLIIAELVKRKKLKKA